MGIDQSNTLREDRRILRSLLSELLPIAQDPKNSAEKIEKWKKHVRLEGEKPMVFVYPDGSWSELLPYDALKCTLPVARTIEYELRKRLIHYRFIPDDIPIIADIDVPKVIYNTMWGVTPKQESIPGRGAYKMISIIDQPSDWKKLSVPKVTYDERQSAMDLDFIQDAVGDLTAVRLVGRKKFSFHLMHWYCDYRGLDNLLYDLYDEPGMVHDIMRFFTEGIKSMLRQYEEQNLLSLNNDFTFHYTGGVGYTDLLPQPDYDPEKIRYCDMWGAAEAQEFAQVSPEMHEEFVLRYEREILEPFGLNGYGCCDDLSAKLENVLKIRNLRRVAVCPWADIAKFTPVLKKDYIMTWKPMPMPLADDVFDRDIIRRELEEGISKACGGVLELVLRDTHTCRFEPERFTEWVNIARESIEKKWDGSVSLS
ncbi:MAG: hypothetical protein K6D94_10815 [Clostridiales bacterium]|nr:hypothetical protein [Clostridiales bacterium]